MVLHHTNAEAWKQEQSATAGQVVIVVEKAVVIAVVVAEEVVRHSTLVEMNIHQMAAGYQQAHKAAAGVASWHTAFAVWLTAFGETKSEMTGSAAFREEEDPSAIWMLSSIRER